MDRRGFLLAAAGGAAGVLLGGCDDAGPSASGAATVPSSTPSTTAAVPVDLDALAATLQGRLVRAADADYDALRLLQCTIFDSSRPLAIAAVATADDVARVVTYARAHQVPFAVRGGGHSYGGWSTGAGLVIDLRAIASIDVSPTGATATIGAGTQLIDVYSALATRDLAFSGGSCPTVGIAGLSLGGGHGLTSRAFGLACDAIRSIEIVTADGAVHECDEHTDADLFWACRGAGAGSFGVVTRLTIEPHALPADATTFVLKYPWQNSARALANWMQWLSTLSDRTTTIARLETTPQLVVAGLHLGTESEANAVLEPMLGLATSKNVKRHEYVGALMLEAGCSQRSVAECHSSGITPGGLLTRQTPFVATSLYFSEPLSSDAIAVARAAIEQHAATAGKGTATLQFDSYGAAIAQVPAEATAFVHRDAFCLAQFASFFSGGDAAPHRRWLQESRRAMMPFGNGESYQNYADPELTDWQRAYYGSNLERLQRVKRTVDPENLFSFAQSIPV